jgi:hypothetical protein
MRRSTELILPLKLVFLALQHTLSPGACSRVQHLNWASLIRVPGLLANVRLDRKVLPGSNAVACYEHL